MRTSLIVPMFVVGGALFAGCSSEETGTPPTTVMNGGGTSLGGSGGGTGMSTGGSGTGGAPAPGVGGSSTGGSGTGGSGTGGAGTGGSGTGGSAMGGAGGGGGLVTAEALIPGFHGTTFQVPCADTPNADDCSGQTGWSVNGGPFTACVGGKLNATVPFMLGGDAGKVYDAKVHFRGIMEPYDYNPMAVTRDAGNDAATRDNSDATKQPFAKVNSPSADYRASGDNNFNTYELHVYDDQMVKKEIYLLNSDNNHGHWTLKIDYNRTIPLYGKGKLELVIFDNNCRQIKNCGTIKDPPCAPKAQTVTIPPTVTPKAPIIQPGLGKDPEHSGQWVLFEVLSVTAK